MVCSHEAGRTMQLSNNYLWFEDLVTPDDQSRVRRLYVDPALAVPLNGKIGTAKPRAFTAKQMYLANPVFVHQQGVCAPAIAFCCFYTSAYVCYENLKG
jgi:hypothetical protein